MGERNSIDISLYPTSLPWLACVFPAAVDAGSRVVGLYLNKDMLMRIIYYEEAFDGFCL